MCGLAVTIGQLVVLSVNMCGMAFTIWSTCGFERKYVWYGCSNLVTICVMVERKYVWYGCSLWFMAVYNLVNLWFCKYVWYGCYNLGQLVVSVNMCGMAVTIWSTCGFERKYVWLLQFGQLVERKMLANLVVLSCYKYVWYGCYNLVNLWF